MPQLWKISREVKRLLWKPVYLPVNALSFWFGATYYDLFHSHKRRIVAGQQSSSVRKAIYLIYPSSGLLPTHLTTLKYLASKGLSVTVVSNLPLNPDEEISLLQFCHRYIERPNFGYDFGGYRDGVLSLKSELSETDQLLLINDSAWFPIHAETDWLDDIQALNVDFAGAVSNYGVPRPNPESFREMSFDYRTDHKNFHYCSFALSIGANILRSPGFFDFWKHFPLTNKKNRTVRRGEIGLTAWVLKNGFSHGDTVGIANLVQFLETLEDRRLLEIATQTIIPEDARMKSVKADLLPSLENMSRQELIRFILTATARQGAAYALADFLIFERGYPFLKKSPLALDPEAAKISLRILEKIDTAAAREALAEAQVLRQPA